MVSLMLRCLWMLAIALPAAAQHAHGGARGAPQLAIGAAFAPSGELWIVGLDAQSRLFVQTSADEGRSWSAPREIPTGGDTPAAAGESRPKIAFGPDGRVVIAYTQPQALPYTGLIRMLRSTDGGRSFSAPFTVHRDRQVITHRFESIAFDARGTLHTVWVDKRDAEASRAAGRRDYRGAAIYRNESADGGQSFGPDIKLADSSCECCRIALAPSPDGGLVALWRHVFAPNQRDHAFAAVRERATASQPVRATFDRWALDACPHHGPGLTPSSTGGYHAVWFGEKDGIAGVRYGRLGADGTPRGEARRLPDPQAEHADVLGAGTQLAIVWRSFDGQATRWRAWLSADDGEHFTLKELGRSDLDNDHPRLVRRGEQIYALWRTTQGIHVERLVP
ncbi:exo-alpha-sialidase [Piscinibacter sp. XHJ-5]|uniref:exo-alpha-sialidase n=1 Tax=Piscinibacter sp. XHJ-5 TaxID=3037797 RepID=UPI0024533D61|nr:exo-alpha-sialidase [Piscinibacter sp. XHJ-5]